jgi:GT2 family glycosyltransferase
MLCPRICVIVLNWNGKQDTLACLASLSQLNYSNFEIVVVDNGSTDDSVSAIREHFPSVRVVETGRNLGYAGGNNVGIREALRQGSDYFLLLNNDTVVDPELLNEFLAGAESRRDGGMFGGKIYLHSEKKQIWYAGGKWDDSRLWLTHAGRGELDDGDKFNEFVETDFVTGCALFVKREVVEAIGLLEERFFLVFEEADWCYRARRQGYKCFFVPRAVLWHKTAASFNGEHSPLRTYFSYRNRLLWAERNLGWTLRLSVHFSVYGEFGRRFVSPLWSKKGGKQLSLKDRYWTLRGRLQSPNNKAWFCGVRDYWLRRFGDCPEWIRALNQQWAVNSRASNNS